MFKKLGIFTLSLTLLLTGCQTKLSPTETLEAVNKKMTEQNAIHQIVEGAMNADIEAEGSEQADALGMLKNLKFTLETSVTNLKSDDITYSAKGAFDANGMAVNYSMFANAEEIIVDAPMFGKLVVVPFADAFKLIEEQSGQTIDPNIVKYVIKDLREIIIPLVNENSMKVIKDENIELIDEYTFKLKDEETKSKALKVTLTKEMYTELTKNMIEAFKNSEDLYKAIEKYNVPNYPATFKEYQAKFDEIKGEDVKASLEESFKSFEDMSYEIVVGYDNNHLVNFYDLNMKMTIPESEENATAGTLTYNFTSKLDYDNVTITRPETDEENSIGLQELIMMFMMGSMG